MPARFFSLPRRGDDDLDAAITRAAKCRVVAGDWSGITERLYRNAPCIDATCDQRRANGIAAAARQLEISALASEIIGMALDPCRPRRILAQQGDEAFDGRLGLTVEIDAVRREQLVAERHGYGTPHARVDRLIDRRHRIGRSTARRLAVEGSDFDGPALALGLGFAGGRLGAPLTRRLARCCRALLREIGPVRNDVAVIAPTPVALRFREGVHGKIEFRPRVLLDIGIVGSRLNGAARLLERLIETRCSAAATGDQEGADQPETETDRTHHQRPSMAQEDSPVAAAEYHLQT